MNEVAAALDAMVEAGMPAELAQRHRALSDEMDAIHGSIKRAIARKDLHALRVLQAEMADTERQWEALVAEIQANQQRRAEELVAAVLSS